MAEPVKTRRPYTSQRHAELRRQTRQAVISAARWLFAERGYNATTIEVLAREAGVAVQTVYAAFGNKRSVLWAVLETSVAGDDEQQTLSERVADELQDLEDPAQRLDRVLQFGRDVVGRSADVHRIIRGAAAADEGLQAALKEIEHRRHQDALVFVGLIVDREPSDPGLSRAADVFYALTSYEIYELLVTQRGWSTDQWQQWVLDSLSPVIAAHM